VHEYTKSQESYQSIAQQHHPTITIQSLSSYTTMSADPDTNKRRRLSYESIQAQTAAAKPYRPASKYAVVMKALLDRNQIREIHLADQLFAAQRWVERTRLCEYIIQAQPSEAVRAKAHTMLAVRGVGLAIEARRK
jgi:hypothetical protein